MLGETDVWEHTKEIQIIWNGRKAYRNISISLFGDNIILFWSKRQNKKISVLKYRVEYSNLTWSEFVNRHLALHNQRAALNYRASELGHVVTQWTKYKKVGYLLNGISKGVLESSKRAIISDQASLRSNFASAN